MSTYVSALEVFSRLAGSDLSNARELTHATSQCKLKPGEALFRVDERMPFAFVVNTGIIKLVYETPAGDSWIKGFAEAGVCFASLMALQDGPRVFVIIEIPVVKGDHHRVVRKRLEPLDALNRLI